MAKSRWTGTPADELAQQLVAKRLNEGMAREFRFHSLRRWRFDFAWIGMRLAVEVDGGAWIQGRHTRGVGFRADCEKLNEAACLGWRVLRVTPEQVRSGEAVTWIDRMHVWARWEVRHHP